MPRYSDTLMDHFMAPRNQGHLDQADAIGLVGVPGEGPFFLLYLHVRNGTVLKATFQTYGCGPTIAAGSMLTEMLQGKTVAECRLITIEELESALGGVPPEKAHCPAMAVGALRAALDRVEA